MSCSPVTLYSHLLSHHITSRLLSNPFLPLLTEPFSHILQLISTLFFNLSLRFSICVPFLSLLSPSFLSSSPLNSFMHSSHRDRQKEKEDYTKKWADTQDLVNSRKEQGTCVCMCVCVCVLVALPLVREMLVVMVLAI